jgi:Protein of unknown function (DUF1800)
MPSSIDRPADTEQQEPAARPPKLSRRVLIGLGALGALEPATNAYAQVRQPRPTRPVTLADTELRLARRITYGLTQEDVSVVRSAGYQGYLEYQLNPEPIDDGPCNQRLAAYPTISMPTWQLYTVDSGLVTRELVEATMMRAIYSRRQLFERMVEFWTDHFHTNIDDITILKVAEDRDAIRANALGVFSTMLGASASSPAMLQYLDNSQSTAANPNQNYARELLELHTMGVDGGYTQADIVDVARCFTGWRSRGNTGTPTGGTFFYDPTRHASGSKLVLGVTIPGATGAAGINEGITVLRILSEHPSTHRFVSRKLIRWLLDYEPSTALINDIAGEFARTGGTIKPVLRRILSYDNMFNSRRLFKRPFHFIVSALRAMNVNITRLDTIRFTYLNGMGQPTFAWGPPDGFPHSFQYWGGLPLPRWNFGASLANGSVGGATLDAPALQALLAGATTSVQVVDRIEALLFAGEMTSQDRSALLAFLGTATPSTARVREAFGLAIGSPAFQWH